MSSRKKNAITEPGLFAVMPRGLAHDLRNLLTPVSTCLHLFAEGGVSQAKAEALLPIALGSLETVEAYIQQARHFSRHGEPLFRPSRLDLIVHRAVAMAEPRWKFKRLALTVDVAREVSVEMDSVLILRLLGNLLANAIEAAPVGSGLRVELQGGAAGWWRLQITDHGAGIGREKLRRLLLREDEAGEDAGLGLAICRKIVQWHGGRFRIDSRKDAGTRVTVVLPNQQTTKTSSDTKAKAGGR